jgi:hypothetical protein
MMADVEHIEVVVAHSERATLRVGKVFLKIDSDQRRTDVEVEAMRMTPLATPEILWRRPPVLALAAVPGTALGGLGEPSTASPAAWAAAGAAVRTLHDDVIAGYGGDVDRDLIRAWWSLRCLRNVRWLFEHGFGLLDRMPEIAVLRSAP